MAHESAQVYKPGGYIANVDLSTHQFKFVKVVAAGKKIDVCAASTDACIGILQNKPKADEAAEVAGPPGISKVVAGGVIAVGGYVQPAAAGKAVAAAAGTQPTWGIALEAAAADGDIITIAHQTGAKL